MILDNAFCIISDEISTSEVIKLSVVAILGCIIPLPFAIPPMWHTLSPIINSTETSFFTVSVVIIAVAARSFPSYVRPLARS